MLAQLDAGQSFEEKWKKRRWQAPQRPTSHSSDDEDQSEGWCEFCPSRNDTVIIFSYKIKQVS